MRNLFKPKVQDQSKVDPLKLKKPERRSFQYEGDKDWNLNDPDHIDAAIENFKAHIKPHFEALDEALKALDDGSSPESIQDTMYQLGYADGHGTGNQLPKEIDVDKADDPNYYLGYQDGKGDYTRANEEARERIREAQAKGFDATKSDGTKVWMEQVHDDINDMFSKRVKR